MNYEYECNIDGVDIDEAECISHIGVARRSGRYPWGSGDDPFQRTGTFASRVNQLRKDGFTYTDDKGVTYKGDTAIAKFMGMDASDFRAAYAMSKDDKRILQLERAKSLRDDNLSNSEIAKKMGINESTVRSLFNEEIENRTRAAQTTADFIRKRIEESGMIDIGGNVEKELGISKEKLNEALMILEGEGYHTFGGRLEQATNPGKFTTLKVIAPKDTPYKIKEDGTMVSSAIFDTENIHSLKDYTSHDGGETFDKKWVYPESMPSKRLAIRYAEDGGLEKDGVIEIRPNVPDLDLGGSAYAQVRILVDKTHYLKGMAVYSDNLPDGVDVLFNTNKHKGTPALGTGKTTVLKEIKKDDPTNPFGSLIKEGIDDPAKTDSFKGGQSYWYDDKGNKHLSLINKRAVEGDWGDWGNKLPSQFLAKQNLPLIKRQLRKTMEETQAEFDDIGALTNPIVKQKLYQSFADKCDYTSVHLQAKALPRQRYQVILPIPSLSDREIYAPNYNDGEQVALVRFPHGGLFEIPVLTVNNRNREARKVMGTAPKDGVGINSKVAEILSGADFDGDTVMVIPTNNDVRIAHKPPLKELKNFDPKMEYPYRKGMKEMSKGATQNEMGKISNLIADMSILGATDDELAKAVKHSMVVIDANKHHLDYTKSFKENDIRSLKLKYQGITDETTGKTNTPAATLITRAKSQSSVPKRRGAPKIDKKTGELIWTDSGETYIDKKGNVVLRTQKSNKMSDTKDAKTLISKLHSAKEEAYADYANFMKHMANQARKTVANTTVARRNPEATKRYKKEVDRLLAALSVAEQNAPRERQAQLMANSAIKAMREDNPGMTKAELKKFSQRSLADARAKVGAKRHNIVISDREWEAIQNGAISANVLKSILDHADMDRVRELATSKNTTTVSAAKIARMQALAEQHKYSAARIAEELGVSVGTVNKYIH